MKNLKKMAKEIENLLNVKRTLLLRELAIIEKILLPILFKLYFTDDLSKAFIKIDEKMTFRYQEFHNIERPDTGFLYNDKKLSEVSFKDLKYSYNAIEKWLPDFLIDLRIDLHNLFFNKNS